MSSGDTDKPGDEKKPVALAPYLPPSRRTILVTDQTGAATLQRLLGGALAPTLYPDRPGKGIPRGDDTAAYDIAVEPPRSYMNALAHENPPPFIVSWRGNYLDRASVRLPDDADPHLATSWCPRGLPAFLDFSEKPSHATVTGISVRVAQIRHLASGPDIPRPTGTTVPKTPPIHRRPASDPVEKRVMKWLPLAVEAAARHGISPHWILVIIHLESRGKVGLTSPKGAQGLMQLMPGTFKHVKGEGAPAVDVSDPASNIEAGTWYFARHCLPAARSIASGSGELMALALAAYNGGAEALKKRKKLSRMPRESREYAQSGLTLAPRYEQLTKEYISDENRSKESKALPR